MVTKIRKGFGIGKIIGIAIVLLAALAAAIPFLLDINQFRPQIESQLAGALGRDVKVDNLSLSLLSGGIRVNNIRIADNPAFGSAHFVQAKSLQAGIELKPLIAGGGQERGLRSGTENVAAIVGFGRACELAAAALDANASRLNSMRRTLERGLSNLGARVFGAAAERLPNTTLFSLEGMDGETLVAQLDRAGFAVASGAACSSASPEPSHTLLAMGVAPEIARGAVRISLGRGNTGDEVERFLRTFADLVQHLKRMTAMAV